MRKFPELNIEWTPAEGADSQLLEVNANGLSPSGSYVYQYLPSHFSEFSVFLPLWDQDGKVWSREDKTNEVNISVTSINNVDGNEYKSEAITSTLIVEDLPWVPESPTDLTVTLTSFRHQVSDSKLDKIKNSIESNLGR